MPGREVGSSQPCSAMTWPSAFFTTSSIRAMPAPRRRTSPPGISRFQPLGGLRKNHRVRSIVRVRTALFGCLVCRLWDGWGRSVVLHGLRLGWSARVSLVQWLPSGVVQWCPGSRVSEFSSTEKSMIEFCLLMPIRSTNRRIAAGV